MNSKERLRLAFKHQIPDRLPMMDSYWTETIERWRAEGLPADVDPYRYFGMEHIHSMICDHTYGLPEKTLEEDENYITTRNSMGMVQKSFRDHRAGAPAYLDHLIKTREDWETYRPLVHPDTAVDRIPAGAREQNREMAATGAFMGVHFGDPIWCLFHSCSMEEGLMMMLEDPNWAADIVMSFTQLQVRFLEELIKQGFEIDGIFVYGDIGSNNGPFFSPRAFDLVLAPAYKLLFGFAREHGWTGMLHSDGDVRQFMSRFIDCHIDALHPFDSKAGMDVREMKPLYGDRLTFVGNISKDIMSTTKDRIEEEVASKIPVAMQGGGYVYHSDHSVPPSVSLENYLFTLECVRKYGVYQR